MDPGETTACDAQCRVYLNNLTHSIVHKTAPLAVFKLQHPALLLIGPDHKHELEAGVSLLVWAARTVAWASMTTCRGTKKIKKIKTEEVGEGREWNHKKPKF